MSQQICPLFGEYANDQAISRAAGTRPGVTAKPVLVATGGTGGTTISISLGVDPGMGFWAWRTPWTKDGGNVQIVEDATVAFGAGLTRPAAGLKRHVLLVGRWKWIAGQIGSDGKPLGTLTAAQKATYSILQGSDSATPSDPAVPVENPPVTVLARVVIPDEGDLSIEWLPDTMMDLLEMVRSLAGKHNRDGDERHIGKFKVSESPIDDEDVLRRKDVIDGIAKPYANVAQFASNIGSTNYPYGAHNNPVKLATIRQSGINVEALSTGGWKAKQNGIYRIDYVVKQWGSPGSGLYQWAALAVKSKATEVSGFGPMLVNERSFFRDGNSEANQNMTWTLDLAIDDVIGLFVTSESPSTQFVYATIEYLGDKAPTDTIGITTGDQNWNALEGQTYPKIVTFGLVAKNATGAIAWSITGGTAQTFSSVTGSTVTTTFPEVGDYTLSLRGVDAAGNIATKTIAVNLAAYQLVPLTISTGSQNYETDAYPLATSILLSAAGGTTPYTWALTGANTTLPSPSIVNNRIVSSIPAAGSYTVEVRCTDSAGSPQIVTKTINVIVADYIEPPSCFEAAETYVLMGDGTGRLLHDVIPGEYVLTIHEKSHERGSRKPSPYLVTDKTLAKGDGTEPNARLIHGIKATPGHLFAVKGGWTRAAELAEGDELIEMVDGLAQPRPYPKPLEADAPVNLHGGLGTQAGTFMISANPEGPWLLVHNVLYQDSY